MPALQNFCDLSAGNFTTLLPVLGSMHHSMPANVLLGLPKLGVCYNLVLSQIVVTSKLKMTNSVTIRTEHVRSTAEHESIHCRYCFDAEPAAAHSTP